MIPRGKYIGKRVGQPATELWRRVSMSFGSVFSMCSKASCHSGATRRVHPLESRLANQSEKS
jgi:hypothetical protein